MTATAVIGDTPPAESLVRPVSGNFLVDLVLRPIDYVLYLYVR